MTNEMKLLRAFLDANGVDLFGFIPWLIFVVVFGVLDIILFAWLIEIYL